MNPNREELLFQLALTKPTDERGPWLDRECGDDKELRQRLEALLAAHEASVGVLGDEPAREVLAPTLDQSLTATGQWSQVTLPYVTNATDISVSAPAPTGNTFYRLRRP